MDGLDKSATGDWEMSFDDFNTLRNMKKFFIEPHVTLEYAAVVANEDAAEKFVHTSYADNPYFEEVINNICSLKTLSAEAYERLSKIIIKNDYRLFNFFVNTSVSDDLKMKVFDEAQKRHPSLDTYMFSRLIGVAPSMSDKMARYIFEKGDTHNHMTLATREDVSDELKQEIIDFYESKPSYRGQTSIIRKIKYAIKNHKLPRWY
jgi:hypothetical protein